MQNISDMRAVKALIYVVVQKYEPNHLTKYGIHLNQATDTNSINIILEDHRVMSELCSNLLYGSNDNPYWLFHDSVQNNDQSLLRLLLYAMPREYKPEMFKSNSFKAFLTAARNSSTAVLDILLPELLGQEDCELVFKLLLENPELSATIKAYVQRTKDSMGIADENPVVKPLTSENKPKTSTRKRIFSVDSFLDENLNFAKGNVSKPKLRSANKVSAN